MKLGFEFFGCVEHDSLFTEAFPDKVLVQLAPRANPYQTPAREPRLHCRQSLTSLSPWLSVIPRHHPITIAPTPRFPYPSFASIRKLDHAGLTGATPCRSICKDPNPTHQIGISSPASPRDSNTGGCTLRLLHIQIIQARSQFQLTVHIGVVAVDARAPACADVPTLVCIGEASA